VEGPTMLSAGQCYGRHIRRREVAGLILTEKFHDHGERTPMHAHARPYLSFGLRGSWDETRVERERSRLT
jgi:hypothetical protein